MQSINHQNDQTISCFNAYQWVFTQSYCLNKGCQYCQGKDQPYKISYTELYEARQFLVDNFTWTLVSQKYHYQLCNIPLTQILQTECDSRQEKYTKQYLFHYLNIFDFVFINTKPQAIKEYINDFTPIKTIEYFILYSENNIKPVQSLISSNMSSLHLLYQDICNKLVFKLFLNKVIFQSDTTDIKQRLSKFVKPKSLKYRLIADVLSKVILEFSIVQIPSIAVQSFETWQQEYQVEYQQEYKPVVEMQTSRLQYHQCEYSLYHKQEGYSLTNISQVLFQYANPYDFVKQQDSNLLFQHLQQNNLFDTQGKLSEPLRLMCKEYIKKQHFISRDYQKQCYKSYKKAFKYVIQEGLKWVQNEIVLIQDENNKDKRQITISEFITYVKTYQNGNGAKLYGFINWNKVFTIFALYYGLECQKDLKRYKKHIKCIIKCLKSEDQHKYKPIADNYIAQKREFEQEESKTEKLANTDEFIPLIWILHKSTTHLWTKQSWVYPSINRVEYLLQYEKFNLELDCISTFEDFFIFLGLNIARKKGQTTIPDGCKLYTPNYLNVDGDPVYRFKVLKDFQCNGVLSEQVIIYINIYRELVVDLVCHKFGIDSISTVQHIYTETEPCTPIYSVNQTISQKRQSAYCIIKHILCENQRKVGRLTKGPIINLFQLQE